ncbi:hypothetical protein FJZ31_09760 [Candidatus Poribacteria bacterium]|nr:hypothetical protein [Candidatus Poribacteria bacterium]
MLSKNVLYYGKEESPPEQIELRAGPLLIVFEPGGGFLRYIRVVAPVLSNATTNRSVDDHKGNEMGNQEILRSIYVAVRDRNWGTIPPRVSNLTSETIADSFYLTFDVECKERDIDFFWRGTVTGDRQGTITFTMDGIARSTFLRNRIGFCVLHPIRECAGQPCIIEKVDGAVERGIFPYYISPHQPFMDIRAISHEVVPGLLAEVRFEGEIFEMEDQRNWTDASFKTYCTPLSLPFPAEVKEGTTIVQSVTLTLKGEIPAATPRVQVGPSPDYRDEIILTVAEVARLQETQSGSLPHIGLGMASHGRPLNGRELERLKALNLSHLRVDLNLSELSYKDILKQAVVEANALGVSLEVALFLSDATEEELSAFVKELQKVKPRVSAWLIFHLAEKSTTEQWVRIVRRYLSNYAPEAKIGAGTNVYFTELNRSRPPNPPYPPLLKGGKGGLDLVCYSINPQVHAFDNTSLVENLAAQAETTKSARQFVGNLPLAVTPVTLKPRFNPSAIGPQPELNPDELPSQVDVRQMSLFGAVWALGSVKYLSESGVYSVTYYETSGWQGVMETEHGSPLPEKFRSLPGSVFPLYHVLADVGEFAGGAVIPITSSAPLLVDGLAVRKDGKIRVMLANFTSQRQQITIHPTASAVGLFSANIRVRRLDETNAEYAMLSPEEFRAYAGESMVTSGGFVKLDILPYGVVRMDNA